MDFTGASFSIAENCDSRPPNRAGRFHTAPLVHRKPPVKVASSYFCAGHPSSVWEPAAVLHPSK